MWPIRPAPKRASGPPNENGPRTGKTPGTVGVGGDGAAGLLTVGALVRGLAAAFLRTTFGFGGLCPASAPPVRALLALCAGIVPGLAPPTALLDPPTTSPPGAAPPAFAAFASAGRADTGAATPRAMRRRDMARTRRAIPTNVGTHARHRQPRTDPCTGFGRETCAARSRSGGQQASEQRQRAGLRQRLVEVPALRRLHA